MSLMPGARKLIPAQSGEPLHYVPGVGRGATPFTTRADLGYNNATPSEPFGKPPPGYIPGRGRGATSFAGGVSRDDATDERDRSDLAGDDNELNCENEQLFKDAEYDDEDREADLIYDSIDARMDERRRSRRESKLKSEISKMRSERPTIHQQFDQYKRALATLTREEWESIPTIGDYSLKRKQQKKQPVYVPAPDSLLYSARCSMQNSTSIGTETPLGISTPLGIMGGTTPIGLKTPIGMKTPIGGHTTSINDLGEARGAVLSITLDKVMDNLSGQTVVDPKGYLTDLNAMNMKSSADIADIKKARTLLKSVITTNPKHAPGWIAAARLEELAGRMDVARELIAQGCHNCGDKEDVWLEAVRLEKPEYQKAILAKAVKILPNSVKIWIEAANKETLKDDRKRVLRKALEFVPNSVRLWKEVISMENETNAYILLKRAVECVPEAVDMWLALARLCPYQEAQRVLNEARKRLPTNADIWITAAKLEESNGNDPMVEKIIGRGLENLSKKGVVHIRSNWLKHAETAEFNSFVVTARAIIKCTINIGIDESMKKSIWLEDGEKFEEHGAYECARAIYKNAIDHMKNKKSLWLALARLEMKHGTPGAVDELLLSAVKYCPKSEVLWLMAAKHKWLQGDVSGAREVLAAAFVQNDNAEAISLAAVKLEREHNEFERARQLLRRARTQCGSKKVWMQSIQLERQLGNYEAAIQLSEEAFAFHPHFDKLWMIAGQLRLELDPPEYDISVEILRRGCEECPWSVNLWVLAIEVLVRTEDFVKARALADLAKGKMRSLLGNSLKSLQSDAIVLTKVIPNSELIRIAKLAIDQGLSEDDAVKEMREEILSQCDLIWLKSVEIELEAGNQKSAYFMMSKALQEFPESGLLWSKAIFLEEKSAQNSKAVDALNKCSNSAEVVLSAAILFWNDKKVVKARKWFERAVTIDDTNGVIWGTFLAFELDSMPVGTSKAGPENEKRIKDLINNCTRAEPTRGYNWNKVAKKVKNWRLAVAQKLHEYLIEYHPQILERALPRLSLEILAVLDPKVTKVKDEPQPHNFDGNTGANDNRKE